MNGLEKGANMRMLGIRAVTSYDIACRLGENSISGHPAGQSHIIGGDNLLHPAQRTESAKATGSPHTPSALKRDCPDITHALNVFLQNRPPHLHAENLRITGSRVMSMWKGQSICAWEQRRRASATERAHSRHGLGLEGPG